MQALRRHACFPRIPTLPLCHIPTHTSGLLLLGACKVLLALGLWLIIKCRRSTYVAHRELMVVLGYVPVIVFAALQTSEQQHATGHAHPHAQASSACMV